MPCDDEATAPHSEDRTAYGLSAAYALLFAACVELSVRVVHRRGGFSRHQKLFIVLVALFAGLRALAFALEPSLYPCAEAWKPTDTQYPGFGVLATLPRLLFFCSYSVLVYTYLVDHVDFSNSRARDGRAGSLRRLAACLVACNAPGLIMQVAYYGAEFHDSDQSETVYRWYIYVFALESLLLSVLFIGYGVALYTWYNKTVFFQSGRLAGNSDGGDLQFDHLIFIDFHETFKQRKYQVALVSAGCSVAFIVKGCLLLGQLKWSLFNNEWHYQLLSSLLCEVLPALFMILMLRKPSGDRNNGLGNNDMEQALVDVGGDGATA